MRPPAPGTAPRAVWMAVLSSVPHTIIAPVTVVLAAGDTVTVVAFVTTVICARRVPPDAPAPGTVTHLFRSAEVKFAVLELRVELLAEMAPSLTLLAFP